MAKSYIILVYKTRHGLNRLYEPWMYGAVAEAPDNADLSLNPSLNKVLGEQGYFSHQYSEQGDWISPRCASLDELGKLLAYVYPELLVVVIPASADRINLRATQDDWQCDGGRLVSICNRVLTQYTSLTDDEVGELAAAMQKHYFLRHDAVDARGPVN